MNALAKVQGFTEMLEEVYQQLPDSESKETLKRFK